MIIASVLAAFALDRWWDMRGANKEQQEVLAGLEAEFREAKALLERYRNFQERIRASTFRRSPRCRRPAQPARLL